MTTTEPRSLMRVTKAQRIFFGAVFLLAIWVGLWGYFAPSRVDKVIPWLVPPLHAQFLGAMYLSGAVVTFSAMVARSYAAVRAVLPAISIWTGMLLAVSFLFLDEFSYDRVQVWVWFGAYLIYPIVGACFAWKHRSAAEIVLGPNVPIWGKRYLFAQGILATALALSLLFAPNVMVRCWPWNITPMLAQIYSAPLLSYGFGSLTLARKQTWLEVSILIRGFFVFSIGVLVASFLHRRLFSFRNVSTWIWFGGFITATSVLTILIAVSERTKGEFRE